MKKLFFLFAMVPVVSIAIAQNTDVTNQTGDYNTAIVTQTGNNTANVDQWSINGGTFNKSNTVTLTQNGDGNMADIDQDRSGGQQSKQTVTTASQTGDNNDLTILQDGHYQGSNSSTVTQNGIEGGFGNVANIHQQGYGNNWIVLQDGDQNLAEQIATSTVHSGTTNLIEQFGTSNNAKQYTSGSDAMSAIIQQGNEITDVSGNWATQTQAGLKSVAKIKQLTNNNTADQEQHSGSYYYDGGYASQHYASITQQGGDYNWAYQYQTENVSDVWANSRNSSEILQDGEWNEASVTQNDGLNIGNIDQLSSFNNAFLTQNGMGNTADIVQKTGDYNVVNLTQDGGSYADIVQDGDNNTIMGLDTDPMATSFNGSTLYVDQIGSYNTLHLQQTNGASATVYQDGITNTSVIIQN